MEGTIFRKMVALGELERHLLLFFTTMHPIIDSNTDMMTTGGDGYSIGLNQMLYNGFFLSYIIICKTDTANLIHTMDQNYRFFFYAKNH